MKIREKSFTACASLNGQTALAMLSAVTVLGVAAPACAASVLDQSNIFQNAQAQFGLGNHYTPARVAQTVTAGLSGTLTQIDLEMIGGAEASEVTVDIYATKNGVPIDQLLGTATLLKIAKNIGSYSTSIALTAGEVFAITPVTYDIGPDWLSTDDSSYAGGTGFAFDSSQPNFTATNLGADFGFRTYVDPSIAAAVPEPAGWALMIGGFGAIGTAMRRRRRVGAGFA
jgi:hypothetical protein